MNYKISKFKDGDFEMDIRISIEEKTIWLSFNEVANLFNTTRQTIYKKAKILEVKEGDKLTAKFTERAPTVKQLSTNCKLKKEGKKILLNLDYILEIGTQLGSNRGLLLKDFLDKCLNENNEVEEDTIIYNNGNMSLAVTISPNEETVWLSVQQIATLFETSSNNIYKHVRNIQNEGEMRNSVVDKSSTTGLEMTPTCKNSLPVTKKSLVTENMPAFHKQIPSLASDGKVYYVDFYNLDMILAVGYRVKSKKAMEFRRWATRVLKEYLLKGYVINEERVTISKENFLQLESDIQNMKIELKEIKQMTFYEPIKEKIFFEGEYFDARELLCSLCAKAKENIIIVDPYFDIVGLAIIKKFEDIDVYIVTTSKAKINHYDTLAFRKQYYKVRLIYTPSFHDRFLIIDKKECYCLGTSLNYMGGKISAINKIEDIDIIEAIVNKVLKNTH